LDIIRSLRGHTSGLAVPHYVVDTPGGGGKIALIPNPVVSYESDGAVKLKDYRGNIRSYPGHKTKYARTCILTNASVGI
jgi:lysine 2,3-aminomutase